MKKLLTISWLIAIVGSYSCTKKGIATQGASLTIIVPKDVDEYIKKLSDEKTILLKLPVADSLQYTKKTVALTNDSSVFKAAAILSAGVVCDKKTEIIYWNLADKKVSLMLNTHQNGDYKTTFLIEPVIKRTLLNFKEISSVHFGLPENKDLSELLQEQ